MRMVFSRWVTAPIGWSAFLDSQRRRLFAQATKDGAFAKSLDGRYMVILRIGSYTVAVIRSERGRIEGVGVTVCSPQDVDQVGRGAKIAASRALRNYWNLPPRARKGGSHE